MDKLEVRPAVKIALSTHAGEFVVVAGKRGMRNLPGGGVNKHELPIRALRRELNEELSIGIGHDYVSNIELRGAVWGDVTTTEGYAKQALWHVYSGKLEIPTDCLAISHEITAMEVLTRDEIQNHDNMSILAKQALLLVDR